MRVLFTRPIDASLEEIIAHAKKYSTQDILAASGQTLGYNYFNNKTDPDLNFVTLVPLVRLALSHSENATTEPLAFGEVNLLCRKLASHNLIRQNNLNESTVDDKYEYLIRLEHYQGNLQEDFVQILSRIHIMLYELRPIWGDIDPEIELENNLGMNFPQLYSVFFGIIAVQTQDMTNFPGIDFNKFFGEANEEILAKLPEIKVKIADKISYSLTEIRNLLNTQDFMCENGFDLFAKEFPLESKPFIRLTDDRFILPVPQFLINRLVDHIYQILNEYEVRIRKVQGRTNIYQTKFSEVYGKVVEKYVTKLFDCLGHPYEEEPPFADNKNNPGPDIVSPDQKIIIEVSKYVPNKTLRNKATKTELEENYIKVAKKFSQSFNWFNKSGGKYKNIFPSNVIFIVITAEYFPGMQMSYGRNVLEEVLQREWNKYFPAKKLPRCLVISIGEFETLCTVASAKKLDVRHLLDEYLYYLNKAPDVQESPPGFKYNIKNFLLTKYDVKNERLKMFKDAYDNLHLKSKTAFF